MLRSVTLGVALSILASACALVEQPPPPGTRPIAFRIHNGASQPARIRVTVPAGELPDAVQPSVVEPGTTTDVTIHLPISGRWTIVINRDDGWDSTRIGDRISEGCPLAFEISPDSIRLDCVR